MIRVGVVGAAGRMGATVCDAVAAADGRLVAEAPEERIVRRAGFFAVEKREQIHALEFPLGPRRDARPTARCRGAKKKAGTPWRHVRFWDRLISYS